MSSDKSNHFLSNEVYKVGNNELKIKKILRLKQQQFIKIKERKKIEHPIYLTYVADKENNFLVDYNVIEVEDFASATIIISYNSSDDAESYHNGVIKVFAGANSNVKIIKIQTLNTKSRNFESSKIFSRQSDRNNSKNNLCNVLDLPLPVFPNTPI